MLNLRGRRTAPEPRGSWGGLVVLSLQFPQRGAAGETLSSIAPSYAVDVSTISPLERMRFWRDAPELSIRLLDMGRERGHLIPVSVSRTNEIFGRTEDDAGKLPPQSTDIPKPR
jgi:hypothetical protein